MMPGILQQMGADNLQSLRKLAEQLPAEARNAAASQAATAEDDEEGKPSALLAVYLSDGRDHPVATTDQRLGLCVFWNCCPHSGIV